MDDKTMLELAARAAGFSVADWGRFSEGRRALVPELGEWWNPLVDDGDALRLAVNLNLAVYISAKKVSAHYDAGIFANQPVGDGCQYAATRRAIVRAAAEIGKGMGVG